MRDRELDVEAFTVEVIDGLVTPEQADYMTEFTGYHFVESNNGGETIRLDGDGYVEYLSRAPGVDELLNKYKHSYESPKLDEWKVIVWIRDPHEVTVVNRVVTLTSWIIEQVRNKGLSEAEFGVDHAITVGQHIIRRLYDIDTERLEERS